MAWGLPSRGLTDDRQDRGGCRCHVTAGSDITVFTPSAALIAAYAGGWAYMVWVYATTVLGSSASTRLS
jgi:hypothetical protein